jgi:hypothetical protein
MVVKASNRKEAEDPHERQILSSYYEIDEGGEAITEKVEQLRKAPPDFIGEACSSMQAMEGALACLRDNKQLPRGIANGLIMYSRKNRARLSAQVLATQA